MFAKEIGLKIQQGKQQNLWLLQGTEIHDSKQSIRGQKEETLGVRCPN